ncbi:receptor-type tyrosine-protein phosphatase F [Podospora australis]|uniref:Receptor-type tyrosine-protein phosphatase F n=1 Tax=Podospora australis TaxID=1536484 RepID=A0AAN6WSM0_9PEZI|nr:receptor-type tyrosine-protein phosphatase F [Podospora australis]
MVVGDSISHGRQGDWTWRYRIWEWFQQQHIPIRFVGPYKGTVPPEEPEAPQPPPFQDEPAPLPKPLRSDGGYALGTNPDFLDNSHHFSAGGRQVKQAQWLIREQVAAYKPDLCLVQLGFNDIGWNVTGPDETLDNMRRLIEQARLSKPDLHFAVANVPQRTPIPGLPDLSANIEIYNALLDLDIPRLSTERSPIALVELWENYSCSEGAYDGLHPNALGEYEIAQAFSLTLVNEFGVGQTELSIPEPIPSRNFSPITNFKAEATPGGIVVTWDPVYGAYEYDVSILCKRGVGGDHGNLVGTQTNRYDTRFCQTGEEWTYWVRARCGNVTASSWTEPAVVIANPQTAPPPINIRTHPTKEGYTISWDPPEEVVGEIDRYGIVTADINNPGSFPIVVGVKGTWAEIKGLVAGHCYAIAVETWTKAGGGPRRSAPSVIVGPNLGLYLCMVPWPRIEVLDTTKTRVVWVGSPSATIYKIWALPRRFGGPPRDLKDAIPEARMPNCVAVVSAQGSQRALRVRADIPTRLLPSAWDYQFAVSYYNGSDIFFWSNWQYPDPPCHGCP